MARAGDVLSNPVTGHTYRIITSAADTGGALLRMEATFDAGVTPPPAHVHPRQEERFEMLEGVLMVRIAGATRRLARGDSLIVPANTPHAMWNPFPEAARAVWETRPALRTEFFFETLVSLAQRGRVNARGVPGLLDLALLLDTYRNEMRPSAPPYVIQRLIFAPIAWLARTVGKR